MKISAARQRRFTVHEGWESHARNYNNSVSAEPNAMKRKTHKRLLRVLFPGLDSKIVERIDKLIDTPTPWMPAYSPHLGQIPGLSHWGTEDTGTTWRRRRKL